MEYRKSMRNCNRRLLKGFLSNQLDVDGKLSFLDHVEECNECWDEVYHSVKAQHPHYYKSPGRRVKVRHKDVQPFGEKEQDFTEVA